MTNQPHLVMFDADRIKEFVFATGRLKEIRGASQLVRDATDAEDIQGPLGLASDQIIFAEGGSGLLKVESGRKAEEVCRQLGQRYHATTHGATLTAIAEPKDGGFHEAVQRAARHLRLAKEDRRARLQHPQSPFSQPCASCGARPATYAYPPEDLLCITCYGKRDRADSLRRDLAAEAKLPLVSTPWGERFVKSLPQTRQVEWEDALLPYDLNDLARLSRPNNYLGFLYADGNGLGDLVQQQQTEDEYRRFSRRVSCSTRAALWLALQMHFPEPRAGQDGRYAPFELIALGGDDVILVTVADQAVPLALTLGRLFQHISAALAGLPADKITLEEALEAGRKAWDALDNPPEGEDVFTLSSGVVIAHPGQPILNLEEQARELLHRAKRFCRGQAATDFHVVSSPVLRSLDDIRREEYVRHRAHLTGRPMTVERAETVLRHILAFKEGDESQRLPHNKLNALYQALFAGQDAAEFEAFFLLSRLRQDQKRKLEAFFAEFDISAERSGDLSIPVLPWGLDEENKVFTVFADLIELYEFTHAGALPGRIETTSPTPSTPEEDSNESVQD